MKVFGREPALVIAAVSSILSVFVGYGWSGLTAEQAGSITAALTAVAAAITALHVRPVAPAVFTGLITSGATLLATYGLDFTQQQIGLVAAASATLVTLIVRQQVTPVDDPRPVP